MIAKLVELRLEEVELERNVFWELRVFDQPDKYLLDIREIIFYVYTKLRTYLCTQWTKFGETSSKTSSKTSAA